MSTEDSNDQNGSGCTANENEHVSRDELKLRLELAKLDIVELRQRVAELEGNGSPSWASDNIPTINKLREDVRDELHELPGGTDE